MKKKINDNSGAIKLLVFGVSLAGLAAAYFFLSPKNKKRLENTRSWAIKMKGDVVERLEQVRGISEAIYNEIIDSVAAEYEKNLKSNPEEIRALAQDLKTHWQAISRSVRAKKTGSAKTSAKPIKKRKAMKS